MCLCLSPKTPHHAGATLVTCSGIDGGHYLSGGQGCSLRLQGRPPRLCSLLLTRPAHLLESSITTVARGDSYHRHLTASPWPKPFQEPSGSG